MMEYLLVYCLEQTHKTLLEYTGDFDAITMIFIDYCLASYFFSSSPIIGGNYEFDRNHIVNVSVCDVGQ